MNFQIEKKEKTLRILFEEKKTKKAFLQENKALFDFLLEGFRLEALCGEVLLPSAKAVQAIKLLGKERKLYHQGQKVFFDPFSTVSFFYVAKKNGDKASFQGRWKLKEVQGSMADFSFLFPSTPSFGIIGGTLRFFEGFVDETKLHEEISSQELSAFLEECKEEEIAVVWEGEALEPLKSLACTPYLKLCDRKGAFADLYFEYGETKILFQDVKKNPVRDLKLEREWEKDLLETDFTFHLQEKSHYYCPLDKVGKSLTFLLEMGWKVEDHLGKKVLRQKEEFLEVQSHGSGALIQGKVSYEEHAMNLSEVIGSFNRQEHFISLDAHHVGLIDPKEVWTELKEEKIVGSGVFVKKEKLLTLRSFLEEERIPIDPKLSLKKEGGYTRTLPAASFQGTLLPYQQEGLDFLLFLQSFGCSGLLADEMGLGKTVQVLAFFSHQKKEKPILIVVPTSLLFNWKREMEKFLPESSVRVYSGPNRSLESLESVHFILTSYSLVRQDLETLQPIEYALIVLDEGQTIKNPDSQIAHSLFQFQSEMRLVLTGTPIENCFEDLWSLYHFLMPGLLGDRKEFALKMHAAASDPRYLKQLQKKIRPFFLRRVKEDVALDLPEKMMQTVFVEMDKEERELYDSWVQKNRCGLLKKIQEGEGEAHRMEVLEAILRLRQLCAHPLLVEKETGVVGSKMLRLFEDLQEVLEAKRKVLIYSQFTQMLQLIALGIRERGYKYVYLDGSTKNREEVVMQFQEDQDTSIFLISLKAGGVGLNLTAADYVFLYDPWWNEAAENQAIDRAHRIGRVGSVIARRYIMAESIEEKLMTLKKHKQGLAQGLFSLEEAAFKELTLEDLTQLLT